jgi:hypothetical protein
MPLTTYKRRAHLSATPAPFPLNPKPHPAFFRDRDCAELKPLPLFTIIASPLRCRSSSGECPSGTASSPSSPSTTAGELWQALALVRRALMRHRRAQCLRRPWSTVDPERAIGPPHCGPSPWILPFENKSRKQYSHKICKEAPELVVNCAAVLVRLEILQHDPSHLKNNYK